MSLCGNGSLCVSWDTFVHGNSSSFAVPPVDADADIAGSGVSAAFVTTSAITLCFAFAWLVLTASQREGQNIIDDAIRAPWRRLKRKHILPSIQDRRRNFWVPVIEKVILNLSDQMLLTGLAMLVAVFALHCSISVYHVTIASDLVWFSSNIHLTTITVLEKYLIDHPTLRNWRVCLMICMAGFLFAATVWQGHWAWYDSESFKAQCLLQDIIDGPTYNGPDGLTQKVSGEPAYWMAVTIGLMAFSYPVTILTLFRPPTEFLNAYLYKRPIGFIDSRLKYLTNKAMPELVKDKTIVEHTIFPTRKFIQRFLYASLHLTIVALRGLYIGLAHALDSYIVLFCLDIIWFCWGLVCLLADREIPEGLSMNGDESLMGFGQIVPILLLSNTVFVFREAHDDQVKQTRQRSSARGIPQESLIYDERSSELISKRIESYEMSEGMQESENKAESAHFTPPFLNTDTIQYINSLALVSKAPISDRRGWPPDSPSPIQRD